MRSLASFLLLCSVSFAQAPPPKDARGCQDPQVLTRLPGCWILRCRTAQYNQAQLQTAKNQKTPVEGAFEEVAYACPREVSGIQIARNAESALLKSGYKIVHKDNYFTTRYWVTAQSGPQWVGVTVSNNSYDVTTVKVKELEVAMQA